MGKSVYVPERELCSVKDFTTNKEQTIICESTREKKKTSLRLITRAHKTLFSIDPILFSFLFIHACMVYIYFFLKSLVSRQFLMIFIRVNVWRRTSLLASEIQCIHPNWIFEKCLLSYSYITVWKFFLMIDN